MVIQHTVCPTKPNLVFTSTSHNKLLLLLSICGLRRQSLDFLTVSLDEFSDPGKILWIRIPAKCRRPGSSQTIPKTGRTFRIRPNDALSALRIRPNDGIRVRQIDDDPDQCCVSETGSKTVKQGVAPQLYNWNSVRGNYLPPSTPNSHAPPPPLFFCMCLSNKSTWPFPLSLTWYTEPVFVNLLRSPWIDSQPGGPVRQPYLSYKPANLHRLEESILSLAGQYDSPICRTSPPIYTGWRNQFLGSFNVYKYRLRLRRAEVARRGPIHLLHNPCSQALTRSTASEADRRILSLATASRYTESEASDPPTIFLLKLEPSMYKFELCFYELVLWKWKWFRATFCAIFVQFILQVL